MCLCPAYRDSRPGPDESSTLLTLSHILYIYYVYVAVLCELKCEWNLNGRGLCFIRQQDKEGLLEVFCCLIRRVYIHAYTNLHIQVSLCTLCVSGPSCAFELFRYGPHQDADPFKPRVPALIHHFVAYKNQDHGAWLRGGDVWLDDCQWVVPACRNLKVKLLSPKRCVCK